MYVIQVTGEENYLSLIYLGEAFWTGDYRKAHRYEPGSETLKKAKKFLIETLKLKIRLIKI